VETTNNKVEMWLNKQRLHSRCADVLAERSPGVAGWGFGEAERLSGEVRMRRVEER